MGTSAFFALVCLLVPISEDWRRVGLFVATLGLFASCVGWLLSHFEVIRCFRRTSKGSSTMTFLIAGIAGALVGLGLWAFIKPADSPTRQSSPGPTLSPPPVSTPSTPHSPSPTPTSSPALIPTPVASVVGNIDASGNSGVQQLNVNSPGSQQNINQRRVLDRAPRVEKGRNGLLYVLRLTINQTAGFWDSPTPFWVQIQMSGPYLSATKSGAYDGQGIFTEVITTEGVPAAAQAGYYEFKTTTPPSSAPFVLLVESESDINITSLRASPTN